jgi:hypothetical protein
VGRRETHDQNDLILREQDNIPTAAAGKMGLMIGRIPAVRKAGKSPIHPLVPGSAGYSRDAKHRQTPGKRHREVRTPARIPFTMSSMLPEKRNGVVAPYPDGFPLRSA